MTALPTHSAHGIRIRHDDGRDDYLGQMLAEYVDSGLLRETNAKTLQLAGQCDVRAAECEQSRATLAAMKGGNAE